jgi:hypothetical protein
MKNKIEIVKELNPAYFWDTEIDRLDPVSGKRLIIERVFCLGTLAEMFKLVDYYGENAVIATLTSVNWLDPKTLNFASKIFNIPKSVFKCYSRIPLENRHWNF